MIIKGVAEVIRTQLMYEPDSGGMKMSDILSIEKKDVGTVLKNKKIEAEIQIKVFKTTFMSNHILR